MVAKKGGLGKGLGKGLDALIPEDSSRKVNTKPKKEVSVEKVIKKEEVMVKISDVEPNREQPRKSFDEDALLELSESIKQFGIIQPLIVQKRQDYYEIIAGERRWRAAKIAGLKEVPVIVKDYTEQEIVEISLIENIQRENLNPIEEAQAYKRLLTEFNLKQDEVAERVSKSRTAITNSMRLLKLDEKIQQMVIDDMISSGHARALLSIEDKDLQYSLAVKIFDEKLSVREVEKLVKNIGKERPQKKEENPQQTAIYQNLEEKMKAALGTKVSINRKNEQKGKISDVKDKKKELQTKIYEATYNRMYRDYASKVMNIKNNQFEDMAIAIGTREAIEIIAMEKNLEKIDLLYHNHTGKEIENVDKIKTEKEEFKSKFDYNQKGIEHDTQKRSLKINELYAKREEEYKKYIKVLKDPAKSPQEKALYKRDYEKANLNLLQNIPSLN